MIQLEFSHCWIVKVGWMEEICCVFAKLAQRTKHIPIAGIFHAKTQKFCHQVFTLHLIFLCGKDQNVSNYPSASRFERTHAPVHDRIIILGWTFTKIKMEILEMVMKNNVSLVAGLGWVCCICVCVCTWLLFSPWLCLLESGKCMWQPVSSITRLMLFPPFPITCECSVCDTSIFRVTRLLCRCQRSQHSIHGNLS